MPQDSFVDFPDQAEQQDFSDFPDQAKAPIVEPSWYDTVASYIPQPVKSTWNAAWEPLSDLPSRAASMIAEPMMQYGESGTGALNTAALYGGAFGQSVGDVLSGLTSPGNLATTAATGGTSMAAKAALPRVAQTMAGAAKIGGVATAGHGVQQMADPNADWMQRGMGALEAVGGGMMARTKVPSSRAVKGAGALEELPVKQPAAQNLDPNYNMGMGDPELAGSVSYSNAPEPMSVRQTNILDESGRDIAPPQDIIPERPSGPWDANVAPEQPVMSNVVEEFNPATLRGLEPTPTPINHEAGQIAAERIARTPDRIGTMKTEDLINLDNLKGEPDFNAWAEEGVDAGRLDAIREDIKANGIKEPIEIIVSRNPYGPYAGKYVIDNGHHRLKIAQELGIENVPVKIIDNSHLGPSYVKQSSLHGKDLPETNFVDPNTGEIRPASQAKPGDIPLTPETGLSDANVPARPAGKVMGSPNMNLPKGQTGMANETSTLPRDLAGARPRYNLGGESFEPKFADDLDKALFIIAQKKPSKRDADFLKFVMNQTGLDEVEARTLGRQVRESIKQILLSGTDEIPPIANKGNGGKPPIKPPTDSSPVAPDGIPNPQVTIQSLSQRLQKAVDDAGKPNPRASEDITALLDEASEVINKNPDVDAGMIRQILGANKALLTSWDLSAPGRQGKAFILDKSWWTALRPMVQAWKSEGAAKLINDSITNHPSGYFRKPVSSTGKVGKSFAEEAGLDLTSTEEQFRTLLGKNFEKYSGIGKSGRAHTAFLNKLRSDQFVSMIEDAKKAGFDPKKDMQLAKAYAKFINDATGRGSVNIGKWKLERNVGVLNDVFFAPKNMSGQVRTWNAVLNPVKYVNYDPVLRKQALKSLFAVAGLGTIVGQTATLIPGVKTSNDPFSSDFRKIKIGDTRIDLFGGYQQFPVAAMKFMMGKNTPTSGANAGKTQDLTAGRFGQNRESVAERFFTNRLSPAGSFVWAWMNNREFDGKPFEAKRALYERVFPIAAKDILELAQEDPALAGMLAVPTTLGLAGTQTYTGR